MSIRFVDLKAVQLWRYEDPILGTRKIVPFNKPLQDKVLIPQDSIFQVNGGDQVSVVTNKGSFELGGMVVYIVTSEH